MTNVCINPHIPIKTYAGSVLFINIWFYKDIQDVKRCKKNQETAICNHQTHCPWAWCLILWSAKLERKDNDCHDTECPLRPGANTLFNFKLVPLHIPSCWGPGHTCCPLTHWAHPHCCGLWLLASCTVWPPQSSGDLSRSSR